MLLYNSGNLIKESVRNSGSSVEGNDVYEKRVDPALNFFSDLYSLLNSISVDVSKLSSCSTSHCLLTTLATNHCLN